MHHWASAAAASSSAHNTPQRQHRNQLSSSYDDAPGSSSKLQRPHQQHRSTPGVGWTTAEETVGRHGRHNFGGSAKGHRLLSEARATFDNSTHDWISSLRGVHLPNTYRRMSSKKRRSKQRGGRRQSSSSASPNPVGKWGHGFENQSTVKDQVAIIAAQNQKLLRNLDEVQSAVQDLQQNKTLADEKLQAIEYLAKMQLSQSQRLLASPMVDSYGDDDYGDDDDDDDYYNDRGGGGEYRGDDARNRGYDDSHAFDDHDHDGDGDEHYRSRRPTLRQPPHAQRLRLRDRAGIPVSPLTQSQLVLDRGRGGGGGDDGGDRGTSRLLEPDSIPRVRLRPTRGPGDRSITMDTSEDDEDGGFFYGACVRACVQCNVKRGQVSTLRIHTRCSNGL